MKRTLSILASLLLLFALACSDGGDPVSPDSGNDGGNGGGDNGGNDGGGDSTTVSFAADVLPLLTASCTGAGCHSSASRSGGLSLEEEDAYDDLVGTASSGYGPALRVAPGKPDESVLYQKLVGNPSFGPRMPYGGSPLSSDRLETIRLWIEEGARDE